MLVKCLSTYGKDLPKDAFLPGSWFTPNTKFDLTVGKNYVVYGMIIYSGYIWYYVCEKNQTSYPFWDPSPLFEVIDKRLSRYWVYDCRKYIDSDEYKTIWAFPEWVNEPYFYYNLVEGYEREEQVFKAYKQLMDLEFPDPCVLDKATILDPEWLMCPFCIDAWQSDSPDGMIVCPMCNHVLHNPRYQNKWESLVLNERVPK